MNYEKKPPNKRLVCVALTLAVLCFGLAYLLACSGCANTVAPRPATSSQPSWDGNSQNSGIIGETAQHAGIVTPHFRDRYNALVDTYGGALKPPLHRDDGISPTSTNTYLIDAQHFAAFFTMNRWKKQNAPPWAK